MRSTRRLEPGLSSQCTVRPSGGLEERGFDATAWFR